MNGSEPLIAVFAIRQEYRHRLTVHYQRRSFSLSVEVTTDRNECSSINPCQTEVNVICLCASTGNSGKTVARYQSVR